MSTYTADVTYGPFVAPAGTVVASIVLTATEAGGAVVTGSIQPSETIGTLTLTDGVWTVKAQAVDAAGGSVGPAAVDPVTYTVTSTVTVNIPVSLTGTNV